MSKTRVSTIAEKLGIESKEVLARLKALGYEAKTASSTVDDDAVAKVTAYKTTESGNSGDHDYCPASGASKRYS